MTNDQAAAFVVAQAALLQTRVAGMVAHNMHQMQIGGSQMYTEEAFTALHNEFDAVIGYKAVVRLFLLSSSSSSS